jgi:hypothetical protein
MSVKNRLFSIVGIPAGAVWLVDSLVVNMPLVMEGAVFAGGIAVAAMGVEGCRKLLHQATAEAPAQVAEQVAPAQVAEQVAPAQVASALPPAMTVRQVGAVPTQEELVEQAFMRGAAAAMQRQQARLER